MYLLINKSILFAVFVFHLFETGDTRENLDFAAEAELCITVYEHVFVSTHLIINLTSHKLYLSNNASP